MKKGYAFAGGNAYLSEKIREVVEKLKTDFFLSKAAF